MADQQQQISKKISDRLRGSQTARDRLGIAKKRVQSILDREVISHQRTLEQKISEQGPKHIRVDPHLVGLAIADLLELNRLRSHAHHSTGATHWYANPATTTELYEPRLAELATLYSETTQAGFGNLIGDALEIIVFKCLDQLYTSSPRFAYQGHFHLDQPLNQNGRYPKTQPPKSIGKNKSTKEADFLAFGYDPGPLCIECKNYREWLYPHHEVIKELIIKATELNAIPVLIARRIHYTTLTNFLEPAGIIAHETYFQYYPPHHADLAIKVSDKKLLGFTDVTATHDPHPRSVKFFLTDLPKIVSYMAERWKKNQQPLLAYALDEINLAQLYTAIGSPAGGKWKDFSLEEPLQSE